MPPAGRAKGVKNVTEWQLGLPFFALQLSISVTRHGVRRAPEANTI